MEQLCDFNREYDIKDGYDGNFERRKTTPGGLSEDIDLNDVSVTSSLLPKGVNSEASKDTILTSGISVADDVTAHTNVDISHQTGRSVDGNSTSQSQSTGDKPGQSADYGKGVPLKADGRKENTNMCDDLENYGDHAERDNESPEFIEDNNDTIDECVKDNNDISLECAKDNNDTSTKEIVNDTLDAPLNQQTDSHVDCKSICPSQCTNNGGYDVVICK